MTIITASMFVNKMQVLNAQKATKMRFRLRIVYLQHQMSNLHVYTKTLENLRKTYFHTKHQVFIFLVRCRVSLIINENYIRTRIESLNKPETGDLFNNNLI